MWFPTQTKLDMTVMGHISTDDNALMVKFLIRSDASAGPGPAGRTDESLERHKTKSVMGHIQPATPNPITLNWSGPVATYSQSVRPGPLASGRASRARHAPRTE